MHLIQEVQKLCLNLAKDSGWVELFLAHGLNIRASNLERELHKELQIDRQVPGFKDFAAEGRRAIEPGRPSHSLLYHALASPDVTQNLERFPSLRDLETVENFIFAASRQSLVTLMAANDGARLAVAVFAYEYRPGSETVHRKHADLCFSRTGIARVGTHAEFYDRKLRGFVPFQEKDPRDVVRVLPARYAAFIAVQMNGDKSTIGPLHFRGQEEVGPDNEPVKADGKQLFWVPVHKLFSGTECIRDMDLHVKLHAHHRNEKLRRVHLEFIRLNQEAGWKEADLSVAPFVMEENIAALTESNHRDYGEGVLIPFPNALVEEAKGSGGPVTFRVPAGSASLNGSLRLPAAPDKSRRAPEFIHARHRIEGGELQNLNDLADDLDKSIRKGEYQAQHYVDHTADGFVEASCPELKIQFPRNVPAYSLVAPPDFFCKVSQAELMNWTENSLPRKFRDTIWRQLPRTLADNRVPPNLQYEGAKFRAEDTTVTAVVCMPIHPSAAQTVLGDSESIRHAHLPDAAAGRFAPGWDVSFDRNADNVIHLAAYGLGSPFPEDAKLCAALSAFWPAVAPDASRTFPPGRVTVVPLTDDEIGMTDKGSWDGVTGPRKVESNSVEYPDFMRTDYVENALADRERGIGSRFSLRPTGEMTSAKYQERVLAMARAYEALGVHEKDVAGAFRQKALWTVLSFQEINVEHPDCKAAQKGLGARLRFNGSIYRFEIYKAGKSTASPAERKVRVEVLENYHLLVDSKQAVLQQVLPETSDRRWRFPDV